MTPKALTTQNHPIFYILHCCLALEAYGLFIVVFSDTKQSVCIGCYTEVGRDGEAISFADGKTPVPIWEPHLCVMHFNTKRLLHFRTEKVNIITGPPA